MKKPPEPDLKYFRITSFGDSTYQWAPSKQSILEMLQSAGALDKDTIVEEVDPTEPKKGEPMPNAPAPAARATESARYFTLPGGLKVKEVNNVMYCLQWTTITKEELVKRCGCEDFEIEVDNQEELVMNILDWVELKPEGEEDATKTDSDVRES